MYHRKLHKYKEFEGQENVIVGKGECIWVKEKNAWRCPSGQFYTDKLAALEEASYINELYQANYLRSKSK